LRAIAGGWADPGRGQLRRDHEGATEVDEVFGPRLVAVHREVGGEHQVPALGGDRLDEPVRLAQCPEGLDQGILTVADEDRELVVAEPQGGVGAELGQAGAELVGPG
jgi:hypothetical protein